MFLLGFVGKSFAVGGQKVCIRSKLKIKYMKQTFWNTSSGGKHYIHSSASNYVKGYGAYDVDLVY